MTTADDLAGRLRLRRIGAEWRGPCPLHGGKNRSAFVVSATKDAFHCFSCGESGTLRSLGARLGVAIEPLPRSSGPVRVAARDAVALLGPLDPHHPYLAARGVDAATAALFESGYFRGLPPFGGRIVIPLHDRGGVLVGHLGRSTDDREPRYILQRGTPRRTLLFNLHRVLRDDPDTVIVTEGVFDVLALYGMGMKNAVATLGCETTTEQHKLLRQFARVLVLFDADDAGAAAAAGLASVLGRRARIVMLPKADPASVRPEFVVRALHTAMS